MVINGYNILTELHRGPITTVYSAEHITLGRNVVLKILNTQWRKEKDLIERFRREAKICARLKHQNIVNIFDFSTETAAIYISMEYVEGQTLDQYFSETQDRDFSDILNITTQILDGLSYAHKQGAIHRDIKPSNIMISNDGHVKITDFGMATISDLPRITDHGAVVGSPAFMSPEQALGEELDRRTDLFSLGATLYALFFGKSPFESDNLGATIQNILKKETVNISIDNPDIPIWFIELMQSLLAKNPKDRPDSAETVIQMIQEKSKFGETKEIINFSNPAEYKKPRIARRLLSKIKNPDKQTLTLLWIFPLIFTFILLLFWTYGEKPDNKMDQNLMNKKQTVLLDNVSTYKNLAKEDSIKYSPKKNYKNLVTVPVKALKHDDDAVLKKIDTVPSNIQITKSELFIVAKPWAEVFIDSIYYETTPLTKSIMLDPGVHFIELKNPNYISYVKEYYLNSVKSETLTVNLKLNVGFLDIRVLPWAEIFIDGTYHVTTPLDDPITVSTGEHVVSLVNPNYATITDTVEIFAGKTLNKRFNYIK